MSNQNRGPIRGVIYLVLMAFALILAACGGGGGASDFTSGQPTVPVSPPFVPPSPPPSPPPVVPPQSPVTASISVVDVTIPDGSNSATARVVYSINNGNVVTVTLGGETKTVPAGNGEVTFTRNGIGDLPVTLANNGVTVLTTTSKASCNAVSAAYDEEWSLCRAYLASYADVVLSIRSKLGTFFTVDLSGVTPVENKTGLGNLFRCGLHKTALMDLWGRVKVACQDGDLKLHDMHYTPGTNVLTLASPVPPTAPSYVLADRNNYRFADPGVPEAVISSGRFFAGTSDTEGKIFFQRNADGSVITVYNGNFTDDGTVNSLTALSYKKP